MRRTFHLSVRWWPAFWWWGWVWNPSANVRFHLGLGPVFVCSHRTLAEDPRPVRREGLTRYAEDHDIELIFFDPPEHFDHAIVGLVHGFGQELAVLYDQRLVLEAMVGSGMPEDEAEEWFSVNTIGAYVGPETPRFLLRGEGLDG